MVHLSETLDRPGATLHYEDTGGGGDAVVFTHGAGVDHAMFDAQFDAVRDAGFRAVTWDMRGHGMSALDDGVRFRVEDALDDLAALITHLGFPRSTLVGHSLGGNLVQEIARRDRTQAGHLVIVDSTWNAGPLTRMERFGLRIAAPSLAMIPASRLPRLMATASATTPAAIEYAHRCFARMPKPVFLDVWRATVSLVDPDPGHRSTVPLTLIRGAADRTGNIATAMPRWAAAERIEEQVIPGAGHIAPMDAPDAVTEAILAALR
ncbi:alpha/beta fold hydrolase [Microbacterium abyssi]|uniref:alpha/beta fold hydrolase n=1 Tax=Microbacterium abyssi TaxID=2782166 RepID=UPI001889AFF1|nr:alpha/beta hydrolase [Microbacterium sp. A18JL241]